MVWLSFLIRTMFLSLCKSSLTYRNHFSNNSLKTALVFHAVSRKRWCVCVCVCVRARVDLLRKAGFVVRMSRRVLN
jgi:hypothetical protein